MPTEKKVQDVERLRRLIEDCVVVISADHSRMKVSDMTSLRQALRGSGVEFRVVKNRLTYLAADAAGRPLIKEIVQGPTGIAFGFDDPLGPAKALTAFITSTRSPLKITGGVLGERTLSADEVRELAALPGKEGLLSQLMGQLQGPITSLAYVLNGPISAFARVLQRRIEGMAPEEEPGTASEAEASTPDSPEGSAEVEGAPTTSEAPTPESPEGSVEAEAAPTTSEAPTSESHEGPVEAEGAPPTSEASIADSQEEPPGETDIPADQ